MNQKLFRAPCPLRGLPSARVFVILFGDEKESVRNQSPPLFQPSV